jgi:aminoglycoside phosphotransferase (APT) family kinase protein
MLTRKLQRSAKRELLRQRADLVLAPEFVDRHIAPLAAAVGGTRPTHWLAGIVQARGTGRATFRYNFGNGVVLYGKAYSDDLGARAYRMMQYLRATGSAADAETQVAEPIAFLDREKLLIMRRAAGVPLDRLTHSGSLSETICAARAAARWLAALHQTEIPFIEPEPPCDRVKIFKLADGLAKAAAAYPSQTPMLLDLLQRVRALAPAANGQLVPTHGQFTPANVFVERNRLTVIDMDRVVLSDPAKDVALFVHRVKTYLLRASGDSSRADAIANSFMEAYERCLPGRLTALPYYRALFLVKGFAKFAKDRPPGHQTRVPFERAYLRELDQVDRWVRFDIAGETS